MAQEAAWHAPYMFKQDNTVVLETTTGKNLRHKVGAPTELDSNGGFGAMARWKVKLRTRENVLEATFQNEHKDGYLRIHQDKIDCAGKGGKFCWFRVHKQNIGVAKFESVEHPEKYLAVRNGEVMIGKGGPFCRVLVRREGVRPAFSTPYYFGAKKTVIIEHRDHAHVRAINGSDGVNSEGGKGELAQFEAIPGGTAEKRTVQLKSNKTGGYLRIRPNDEVDCAGKGGPLTHFNVHTCDVPNTVMLERNGKYLMLAPAKKSLKVGDGKNKRCIFTFYRDN